MLGGRGGTLEMGVQVLRRGLGPGMAKHALIFPLFTFILHSTNTLTIYCALKALWIQQ